MKYTIITGILALGLAGCNLNGVSFDVSGLPSLDVKATCENCTVDIKVDDQGDDSQTVDIPKKRYTYDTNYINNRHIVFYVPENYRDSSLSVQNQVQMKYMVMRSADRSDENWEDPNEVDYTFNIRWVRSDADVVMNLDDGTFDGDIEAIPMDGENTLYQEITRFVPKIQTRVSGNFSNDFNRINGRIGDFGEFTVVGANIWSNGKVIRPPEADRFFEFVRTPLALPSGTFEYGGSPNNSRFIQGNRLREGNNFQQYDTKGDGITFALVNFDDNRITTFNGGIDVNYNNRLDNSEIEIFLDDTQTLDVNSLNGSFTGKLSAIDSTNNIRSNVDILGYFTPKGNHLFGHFSGPDEISGGFQAEKK